MRLQATHGPTYQHCHEHAHHINPEHLSEQDPTQLQPYEWATVAKSKAAILL